MEVSAFSDIEQEFIARVHSVVWCSVATVDTQGRPRSRIWHPYWDGPTGWVLTRRQTLKTKHLDKNPFVSVAYVKDISKPVYIDAKAEWVEELDAKQRIWDAFKNAPPPLGYDPIIAFPAVTDPGVGLLKFTPWRIEVANIPGVSQVWHAPR